MSVRTSSAPRGSERLPAGRQGLAVRRRLRRRRAFLAFCVLLLVVLGALVWGLRQNFVRISSVDAYGSDASFAMYATNAMQGNYFGIIPRDSIFFFPETRIRDGILVARPDIAAVSIFRNGLTGISIKIDERVPVARWCGSTFATSSPVEDCYLFDAKGFIFATTSALSLVNSFAVYESLVHSVSLPQAISLIGSTLPDADKFPAAFDFARQLDTFGSPVTRVILREDEVDDYLSSGTRITYLLGDEQNAFTALVSAQANFNLADGSIEYVDLRFDGKVYVKKALGTRP